MQNRTRMGSKILFIVPYPLKESPSQRFRFEQYFQILKRTGYRYDVQSFLDSQNWQVFFKPGNHALKVWVLVKGFTKRFLIVLKSPMYDFIFVHREASPVGPPVFEWLLARIFRKKIIYDFDDAIWQTDRSAESMLLRLTKWRSKVASICRWSYKVSCGNKYLQQYALKFNPSSIVNPTTIDTENKHNANSHPLTKSNQQLTIGWTGSHSTLKYLEEIENVLAQILKANHHVNVTIIADQKPSLRFPFTYIPWTLSSEIEDLLTFDIGIMPLPDNEWSQGKCGFKILQYMALQIPAVASPVGVNTQIISDGVTGFLCGSEEEWLAKIAVLIEDPKLRKKLGFAGHQEVIRRYSVTSNSLNFLSLFK